MGDYSGRGSSVCKGPVAGENSALVGTERRLVWLQCRTGSLVSSVVPVSMGRQNRGVPLLEGLRMVIKAQAEGELLESMADTAPRLLQVRSRPPSFRRLESRTPHFPGSQTAGVLGGWSFPLATGIPFGPGKCGRGLLPAPSGCFLMINKVMEV